MWVGGCGDIMYGDGYDVCGSVYRCVVMCVCGNMCVGQCAATVCGSVLCVDNTVGVLLGYTFVGVSSVCVCVCTNCMLVL